MADRREGEARRIGPRDRNGRLFTRKCVDANCDGELAPDGPGSWRCNGLTYRGRPDEGYPLEACRYWHSDGDVQKVTP